jgi:hypothetical protein
MDLTEGNRRNIRLPDPTPEIPEDDQTEPWGWGDKEMPRYVRRRLKRYREFLEREANADKD